MTLLKNPGIVYLTLWSLYSLKGILYPDGSIINQALMFLILVISLIEAYKVWTTSQTHTASAFFISVNLLLIMYTIYGMLLFVTDGLTVYGKGAPIPSMYFLEGAWVVLMPIYVCYLYTRKGYLTSSLLSRWMVVFLIISILQYYHTQRMMLERMLEMGRNVDGFTNNAGYILLAMIPGMLLFKRKLFSFAGIAVCVAFVLASVKRGAILISASILLIIILHELRRARGFYKIGVVILVSVGLFFLFYYIENYLISNDYFNARLEATLEGDSSNRDELYTYYLNVFLYNSNPIQVLFGRGALSTIKLTGTYAHNDWLEILLGQGLIGILLFLHYWIRFYKTTRSKELCEQSRFILTLLLITFGMKSLFSMSITGMPIYATSVFGFALADGFRSHTIE